MKRRYQVRWYEYNLTNWRTKKFFFEITAILYTIWLWQRYSVNSQIRFIEDAEDTIG